MAKLHTPTICSIERFNQSGIGPADPIVFQAFGKPEVKTKVVRADTRSVTVIGMPPVKWCEVLKLERTA